MPDDAIEQHKDPLAVEFGRRGGLKGGRARAERLTADERSRTLHRHALGRRSGRPCVSPRGVRDSGANAVARIGQHGRPGAFPSSGPLRRFYLRARRVSVDERLLVRLQLDPSWARGVDTGHDHRSWRLVRQVAAGGPVTVTDPAITRFVMSTDWAVDLALEAARVARCGEVFVFKMPAARGCGARPDGHPDGQGRPVPDVRRLHRLGTGTNGRPVAHRRGGPIGAKPGPRTAAPRPLELGYNYRLTDVMAALGTSQLARLDAFLASRRRLTARYRAALAEHWAVDLQAVDPAADPATPAGAMPLMRPRNRLKTTISVCRRGRGPLHGRRVLNMARRGAARRC